MFSNYVQQAMSMERKGNLYEVCPRNLHVSLARNADPVSIVSRIRLDDKYSSMN